MTESHLDPLKLDSQAFRRALGCFATGVTVVTAVGPRREIIGITANSFSSVSLEPPLVLFSLNRRALSLTGFLQTHHFAVNILRAGQEKIANQFAQSRGEKWKDVDFITWDSGCPILKDALACFECKIRHTYRGGDHIILVGEVLRILADPEGEALLFFRGKYREMAPGD
ncbi:MAG: flavin reductase family protein [Pseudomonadota bacterium]